MKLYIKLINKLLLFFIITIITFQTTVQAQGDVRWLRLSRLQAYYQDYGTETETDANTYMGTLSWPAEYGLNPYTLRAKGLWIGAKNFYDPTVKTNYKYKAIAIGPRGQSGDPYFLNKLFVQQIKLIGRYEHPLVYVNDQLATINNDYDVLDEVDPNLISDRMIVNTINTQMGITVTRKIMSFTDQYHNNFFVYDYVFKNTGIIDANGTVYKQTLDSCVFLFPYRYSLAGEARPNSDGNPTYPNGWTPQSTRWGINTLIQVVGTDPTKPDFKYRGHYAFYGPHSSHPVSDDWGAPNENEPNSLLAAARYVGVVVLHADKSAKDKSDDPYQPRTTATIMADAPLTKGGAASPYDAEQMALRYQFMTQGHDPISYADAFFASGQKYANVYASSLPYGSGGPHAIQGFGPYTLEPGDSIHIVLAEGVAGLNREKNREVASNWYLWEKNKGTPPLITPDGRDVAPDHNAYKNAWVFTCEDSIKQTFQRAIELYKSGFNFPQPPPAPNIFMVKSGGNGIKLSWSDNARSWPNFDGYVLYRSTGTFYNMNTKYEKIWECNKANAVEEYFDTTARRGFDYYYFIQTKDDGSTNPIQPGVPLVSSQFLTQTTLPANLLRPGKTGLEAIRVVPNPYIVKSRRLQFGDPLTGFDRDRIAFLGLPGECTIRVFTERGELIWEKEHNNGSGDEYWNSQTKYGQMIVSGIYIVHFQTPDGKSTIRKLIVVR